MLKRYFVNLDGLRFIAASTVAVSHLETLKHYRNIPFLHNRFFENSAQISVTFFFVLSGFLIMWWFLEETGGDTTKISTRRFYSNRIARTWPLYFLVVFISLAISFINGTIPNDPFALKRYVAYLFFLPNIADVFFQKDIYLSPTWSLAVEEFFYFFFPLLLLKIRKEYLLQRLFILSIIFIIISTLLNRIFLRIYYPSLFSKGTISILTTLFERYRFYSFLLGAISAVTLYNNILANYHYKSKFIYIAICLFTGLLFFNGITFSFLTQQIYSVLFAVLIFLIAANNRATVLLNNRLVKWGGKISYGIYMLHMFAILCLINQGNFLLQANNKVVSITISWIIYLAFVLTISHYSYRLFENPIRVTVRKWLITKTQKN